MAKHSSIGASSSERWFACPGSVRLIEKAPPQGSNPYADEGTAAHELAELCLLNKTEPSSYIGEKMKNGTEVTEEMADAVQVYLDTINNYMKGGKFIQLTEVKFDLSCIYPGLFGTADCVLISSDLKRLAVFDYKHGAGKPVEVEENKQLLYYTLGAINFCSVVKEWLDDPSLFGWNQKFEVIDAFIVQPRCRHKDGPVRVWTIPASVLNQFADELKAAAIRTEAKDAPLCAGSHCKFCPAMSICPAIGNKATEMAIADFQVVPPAFPAVDSLEIEKISQILSFSEIFSEWLKSVEAHALQLLEQGLDVPGYKLVKKRANRTWTDEDQVADKLGLLLPDTQIWEKKLLSPAKVEKLIGKKQGKLIEEFITVPDNGNTIAPESDKRPAVQCSAICDFTN